MTASPRPGFHWRILPVMLATAFLSGPLMVAAASPGSGITASELASAIFVTALMTLLVIIPALLIWSALVNRPGPATLPARAVRASVIAIWSATLLPFLLLDIVLGQGGGMMFAILPWSPVPVAIGALLTWFAFRGLRTKDIGPHA